MVSWNLGPCEKRPTLLEWIDSPDITDEELLAVYQFMEKTERLCGGYRTILNYFKDTSSRWINRDTIKILDLYCGMGNLSNQVLQWAKKNNFDVHILAVDKYGRICDLAKSRCLDKSKIIFEAREWTHPAFLQAQQFDYVMSSLALHHQEDDRVVPFLKTVNRVAKRGYVIGDWLRDIRAWGWMKTLTKLSREEAIRHDGPLSIRRGFTVEEVKSAAEEAGMNFATVQKHLGHRFSLSGEKGIEKMKAMEPAPGLAGT